MALQTAGGGFPLHHHPKSKANSSRVWGASGTDSIPVFPGAGEWSQNSNQNWSVNLEGAHLEPASVLPST